MFVPQHYRYDNNFVRSWNRLNLAKVITSPKLSLPESMPGELQQQVHTIIESGLIPDDVAELFDFVGNIDEDYAALVKVIKSSGATNESERELNRQLTSTSSTIYQDGYSMPRQHGFQQTWYPAEDSSCGKQYIESENSYCNGKKIGLYRKWHKTGNLFKEVEYSANEQIVAMQLFDSHDRSVITHSSRHESCTWK